MSRAPLRRRRGDRPALFYRPNNPAFSPPAAKRPKLLVFSHGGPTLPPPPSGPPWRSSSWTAAPRFGVWAVHYGGISTCYGRQYPVALKAGGESPTVRRLPCSARFLVDRGDAYAAPPGDPGCSAAATRRSAPPSLPALFRRRGQLLSGVARRGEALPPRNPAMFESRF